MGVFSRCRQKRVRATKREVNLALANLSSHVDLTSRFQQYAPAWAMS